MEKANDDLCSGVTPNIPVLNNGIGDDSSLCMVGPLAITGNKNGEQFKCEKCGNEDLTCLCFKIKEEKQDIIVTHHHSNNKPHLCEFCGKAYCYIAGLRNHRRSHTNYGNIKFICEFCGLSIANLSVHRRVHTKERPYLCEDCGKDFSRKDALVAHRRLHTKERPYQCKDCGRRFVVNRHLVRHGRIHTKEKPYHCDICGKDYTRKTTLASHACHRARRRMEAIQAGNIAEKAFAGRTLNKTGKGKPHDCEVCGKSMASRITLLFHRRLHTEKITFSCGDCGKDFTRKDHLVVHRLVHTNDPTWKTEQIISVIPGD